MRLGKYLKIVSQETPLIWWNTAQNSWKPISRFVVTSVMLVPENGLGYEILCSCSTALIWAK
jgi:hypothetical protein